MPVSGVSDRGCQPQLCSASMGPPSRLIQPSPTARKTFSFPFCALVVCRHLKISPSACNYRCCYFTRESYSKPAGRASGRLPTSQLCNYRGAEKPREGLCSWGSATTDSGSAASELKNLQELADHPKTGLGFRSLHLGALGHQSPTV